MHRLLTAVVVGTVLLPSGVALARQPNANVIAVSSDEAPGASQSFDDFYFPSITSGGDLQFFARYGGTLSRPRAIFGGSDGALQALAVVGESSTWMDRAYSELLPLSTSLSFAGDAVVGTRIGLQTLIEVETAGGLTPLAVTGETYDGYTLTGVHGGLSSQHHTYVSGTFDEDGSSKGILLRDLGSGLTKLLVEGDLVAGSTTKTVTSAGVMEFSDDGSMYLKIGAEEGGTFIGWGAFRLGPDGNVTEFLSPGEVVDSSGATIWNIMSTGKVTHAETFAVKGLLAATGSTDTPQFIGMAGPGGLELVVREGDFVPGTTSVIDGMHTVQGNRRGDILTEVVTDTGDSRVLRRLHSKPLEVIDLGGRTPGPSWRFLAEDGSAVLYLTDDGVGGFYHLDVAGDLRSLLEVGDVITLDDGSSATIASLSGYGTVKTKINTGVDSLADDGTFILAPQLDDGRRALVTIMIPEPGSLLLLALASLALLQRNRWTCN